MGLFCFHFSPSPIAQIGLGLGVKTIKYCADIDKKSLSWIFNIKKINFANDQVAYPSTPALSAQGEKNKVKITPLTLLIFFIILKILKRCLYEIY